MDKRVLVIDPGHGLPFPGACANGIVEADYALSFSRGLYQVLEDEGIECHMTRVTAGAVLATSVQDDLSARCRFANGINPNLFISVHCNAAESTSAKGFEIWTSPGQTMSDVAADDILHAHRMTFPGERVRVDMSDGDGDKEAKFRVLVGTHCPAVLVELGFVTNEEEASRLKSSAHRSAQIMAVASGILSFLNRGVS